MIKSIGLKLLILLSTVSIISLSSSFILRELMVRDFREYLEGELENRVYSVMAHLEGTYEKFNSWDREALSDDIIWALMLGLDTRIKDKEGNIIIDRERVINTMTPLMKRRILAISGFDRANKGEYTTYPLFLGGNEIGSLEVRFLKAGRQDIYIKRADRFLLLSLLMIGGLTIILSIFFSRKITYPIRRLDRAAQAIREGDLKSRVNVSGNDEITRLSETFNSLAKKLEIQESLRKKLMSNITHELRTPISAIRGEIEGMIDGVIPINKEEIQSLGEEIEKLKFFIDGMEELARAEASVLTLRKQSIQLCPFLKNILTRFSRVIMDRGIISEIQCDERIEIKVDPERMSQVMINLIDNALKATRDGERIWIKAWKEDFYTYIEVGDSGCGIKEKELPFIFERFYKSFRGGLGLGLAIVKEILEAHDIRIEVKSEYGKGTVFTMIIPST